MTMPIGRRTLLVTGCAILALGALGVAPALAEDAEATAFVRGFADKMAAIVNGPQAESAKKQLLAPVIDENVDVATIARFCLGRVWNTATPAQQQKYVAVFHRVMLNNINGHLGEYTGVSFAMGDTRPQGDNVVVSTVITRPNKPPANVGWVVSRSTGAPKVVDVIAEGASLRLEQRDDYASYLSQHGNSVDALITALERQMDNA
jgi:phospholipid transport system substrate-binding protein